MDTETPRPEKLVVDFDTTVNSSPTDISGKGNHGTFKGTASYSPPDKAFDIPDAGNISATLTSIPSADFVHSVSVWVKFEGDTLTTSFPYLYFMGVNSNYSGFGLFCAGAARPNQLHVSCWTLDFPINFTFSNDTWYHVTYTYSGGGWSRNSTLNAYVNGIEYGFGTNWSSGTEGTTPTIATSNVPLRLGTVSTGGVFDGKISNFKLYNVVLEPSEVKKLYNLGRTGRSMVISDTAVGIGKVPGAQLDVRGNIKTSGMVNNAGMRWYINGDGGNAIYTVGENWFSSNGASNVYGTVKKSRNGADVSAWDATTGFFTAPEDGIYSIDMVMFINGFSGDRWGGFQLQNSTGGAEESTYTFYTANISTDDTMSYSKTVYMKKGWKFRFYTPQGTVTLYISGMHSSLNIHKIS